MTDRLKAVIDEFCNKDYVFVSNSFNCPNKRISETFIRCHQSEALEKAADLILEEAKNLGGINKVTKTLMFFNSKHMSELAAEYLASRGIPVRPINGDRTQDFREQSLYEFRCQESNIMVASDVMMRG